VPFSEAQKTNTSVKEPHPSIIMTAPTQPRERALRVVVILSCIAATLHFVQFYMVDIREYINLSAYTAGQERLPFQRRLMMMLLFRSVGSWVPLQHFCARFHGIYHDTDVLLCYVTDVISLAVAGICSTLLYRAASNKKRYTVLVYPLFLAISSSTYLINNEGFTRYLYDLPSLAFFSAGLWLIFTQRFAFLMLVVGLGTLNRETTLFLIPIFLITAWLRQDSGAPVAERLRTLPWLRFAALAAVWSVEKVGLSRLFRHNDASEDFIHLRLNLHGVTPAHWAQVFSACAYLLPILWLLRRRVRNQPVTAGIYVFPLWVIVMAFFGMLIESRIFGELSGYCAVICVLLIEDGQTNLPMSNS
jgi:hypothetical protein